MQQTNNDGVLQAPLGSGFTAAPTAGEVIEGISLAGKVAIVTGGYMGISLETTKTLALLSNDCESGFEAVAAPPLVERPLVLG